MPIQITLFLVLTSSLLLKTTASPPQPPSCTDELVSFSPCLAYVSLPPNKITNTVSKECCSVVLDSFSQDETNCFCYLTKQPSIFGFPFNQTRVVSLPFVCVSINSSLPFNLTSLDSVCSAGSRALPPLRSARGSVISDPDSSNLPDEGPDTDSVQSPSESIPPEFDNSPPIPLPKSNVSATPMGSNFPASPPPILFTTAVEDSSSAKDISKINLCYLLCVIVASVIFILVQANVVIYLK